MKTKHKNTKQIFQKLFSKKWFFKSKKGSAMAISLTVTGFMVLASLGVSSIIISSFKGSTNAERNNNAFLAAESAIEIALFEISGHSSGFEVRHNFENDDHSRINLMNESNSESWWSAESRNSIQKSISDTSAKIVIPIQNDLDDDSSWDNWIDGNLGTTKLIKLYSDNTSCASNGGKPCPPTAP